MSGTMATGTFVGRLTRGAEMKYTSGGAAICSFSIATDSRVKKGDQWIDEPSYWDVDLWGKTAESVNQYLTKGKLVAISGSIRIEKWENDGQPRQKVRVNADTITLLGGKEGHGEEQGRQEERRPPRAPASAPVAQSDNSDIPF